MDFTAWDVDLEKGCASHSSGFELQVEGNPLDPSAVHPGKFPPGCTSIDQVRLVRTGVEALSKAAKAARRSRPRVAPRKPVYKAPADKPRRATLSLKKNRPKDPPGDDADA